MANVHIRFDDDIDQYEPSDSDNELTEKERKLLTKSRKKPDTDSESEEEIFGIDDKNESSDDDDNINIANSDIEGQEDDDLPDVRAWGKNKRQFYSTDYVDQDYGGYQGKDAQAAEFEEEEAKTIQKRLAEQLNDEDFSFEFFDKNSGSTAIALETNEEIVKSDLSNLSKRELIQLLEKDSPELFVLVKDCKEKLLELKSSIYPLIQKDLEDCEALEFIKCLYHLTLNYCTNIYMYILLKANKLNVKNHPVLKRLYQYRHLISQLEPIYVEIVKPQIEIILNSNDEIPKEVLTKPLISIKKNKKLNVLLNNETLKRKQDETEENRENKQLKSILNNDKSTKSNNKVQFETETKEDSDSEDDIPDETEADGDETISENAKRAITYQIAKNKGLTPHRKKEQRNPRVKHRNKFRKAKIRRKGAVREVRKELSRYGGEISGIKSSVSKSIKLK